MDYYNQNSRFESTSANYQNLPSGSQGTLPKFNPQQFAQVAATLNQPALERLVMLARIQGISDADISAGLEIIKSLR